MSVKDRSRAKAHAVFILISFALIYRTLCGQQLTDNQLDFALRQIENNCGACFGGTPEKLEANLHIVERALESGTRRTARTMEVVGQAYLNLSIYAHNKKDSLARRRYLERAGQVYVSFKKLFPSEKLAYVKYAEVITALGAGRKDQVKAFRDILVIDARDVNAHLALGVLYYNEGHNREAEAELSEAFEQCSFEDSKLIGDVLISLYRKMGRQTDLDRVQARVAERQRQRQ